MLPGPKLQLDIVDVVLRFRRRNIAIVGDIKEMFSQVVMAERDRPYHRILWRGLDPSNPVKEYQAARLTFGDRASPYLAQQVVRTHAANNSKEFPLAATVCSESMYMDDVMDSQDSDEEAIQVREQLTQLLAKAGFQIRRWCSNSATVLQGVPEDDRATGVKLEESELPSIKTLGVKWDASTDMFGFDYNKQESTIHTKRSLLSRVATLFDPLQFLAPFTIRAKMLLQEAWILGLGWDEEFPPALSKQTMDWFTELPLVAGMQVPRCYKNLPSEKISLHTFTDASTLAYGAVTFLRSVSNDNKVTVRFVIAKAKVAPLKSISIPRLELMAALLGLRIAIKVSELLNIPLSQHTFWSDSMDVVHWIRGQSRRYKPFVSHRVAEIQSNTRPSQWNYVPGKINPADLATRGVRMDELITGSPWIQGPEFLYGGEHTWPSTPVIDHVHSDEALTDMSQVCTQISDVAVLSENKFPIDSTRFSVWMKLLRTTAWVLRFIKLTRKKGCSPDLQPNLQVSELQEAERLWIKKVQHEKFGDIIASLSGGRSAKSGPLKTLLPFLDNDGILRVGGRLHKSELPYEAKHPILIPCRNHIATLIVRHFHGNVGKHAKGVNATLAEVRQRFWIVHGREEVKRVNNDCTICTIMRKKLKKQIMASLPAHRITVPVRAFAISGVDYAGPFLTKLTRRVTTKRYLCLFTCTTSRAVHLELAYSLDTDSFLNAFSRMVARRGKPEQVISDNGTNFIGANRELSELVQAMDHSKIIDSAANQGIKWKFNPPLGSHHGGVFEALIKSAKRALKAILGEARVSDEELHTAIVEVEGLMNSRPLTYCSNDPRDEHVLTPNHFLYGQAGGQLAPRMVDELACSPRQRWRFVQGLVNQVWKRWNKEYLSLLQNRGKWWSEHKDLRVNDIVTLADPSNPRGRWPLGRITETYVGADGHVRTVKVLSGGKTFVRPITKLCPLLTKDSAIDEVTEPVGHGGENGDTKLQC